MHKLFNQPTLSKQLGPLYKTSNQSTLLALLEITVYKVSNQSILLVLLRLPVYKTLN